MATAAELLEEGCCLAEAVEAIDTLLVYLTNVLTFPDSEQVGFLWSVPSRCTIPMNESPSSPSADVAATTGGLGWTKSTQSVRNHIWC